MSCKDYSVKYHTACYSHYNNILLFKYAAVCLFGHQQSSKTIMIWRKLEALKYMPFSHCLFVIDHDKGLGLCLTKKETATLNT